MPVMPIQYIPHQKWYRYNKLANAKQLREFTDQIEKLERYCRRKQGYELFTEMCEACKQTLDVFGPQYSDVSTRATTLDELWTNLTNIIKPVYDDTRRDRLQDHKLYDFFQSAVEILWYEDSSDALGTLIQYFETHDEEIKRLNTFTYQYKKCVMTLPASRASVKQDAENEAGTTVWFMTLWNRLTRTDKGFWIHVIEQMVNRRFREDTMFYFHVSVRPFSPVPVIFYVNPLFDTLAVQTFRPFNGQNSSQQALDALHDPHPEYRAFTAKAYDSSEEYLIDSRLRLYSLLTQLKV